MHFEANVHATLILGGPDQSKVFPPFLSVYSSLAAQLISEIPQYKLIETLHLKWPVTSKKKNTALIVALLSAFTWWKDSETNRASFSSYLLKIVL